MKDPLKTVAAIFRCYNKKMWVLALGQGVFFLYTYFALLWQLFFTHLL